MSGHGFGPVWGPDSRLLILGTWPSPKSREMGFYYGHPQNRFWPLLAALTGRPRPQTIPEKKALILESGLALPEIRPAAHRAGGPAAAQHQPGQRRLDYAPAGTGLGRSPCPVPEGEAVNKA